MSKDFDKRDLSGSSNGFALDASEARALFLKAVELNHGDLLAEIFEFIRKEASQGKAECSLIAYSNYHNSPFPKLKIYGRSIMSYLQNKGYQIKYEYMPNGGGRIAKIVVSWPNPSFRNVEVR